MERTVSEKSVIVSEAFKVHRKEIYAYGLTTFGFYQAEVYERHIRQSLETLSYYYNVYPECRHLTTKNRIYRNIILDAHIIIYRITDERFEVLDIIHSASSIRKIRSTKNIKI